MKNDDLISSYGKTNHPVTYTQILAVETKRHFERLAALDDAADWIRKIESDLKGVVDQGCYYSTQDWLFALEDVSWMFDDKQESNRIHRALRIAPAAICSSSQRLMDAFFNLGWVIEAVINRPQIALNVVILWKPGSEVRLIIYVQADIAESFTKQHASEMAAVPVPTSCPSSDVPQ